MNIFDSSYHTLELKWEVKAIRNFTEKEINAIVQAKVVSDKYGMAAHFILTDGSVSCVYLHVDSEANIGDNIDMTKAKFVVLGHSEVEINRIKI